MRTPLLPGQPTHPAYLVRLTEDAWEKLSSGITVSIDDGVTINFPNHPLRLEPRATGTPSELHLHTGTSLQPFALAASRLVVPVTSQAAQKLKSQNDAIKPTPMGRTHSSPQFGTSPMIPLKTRVVQLLALGPTSVSDIVKRVGGAETDIMRVVNVVGTEVASPVPTFTLSPSQYSKVKIGTWKYTRAEQQTVIKLAKAAFDKLDLPADADERRDLEEKEREIKSPSEEVPKAVESPLINSQETKPKKSNSPTRNKPKPQLNSKQIASSKQIAKFKAESAKRASSLPVKKTDSPVIKEGKKRKREDERKRMSPTFTSSEDERPTKAERTDTPVPVKDPESLRDRYEELFPAYQLLTSKLVALHQTASVVGTEVGSSSVDWKSSEEVKGMVKKWEKWHNELAEIRRWFSDVPR